MTLVWATPSVRVSILMAVRYSMTSNELLTWIMAPGCLLKQSSHI